MLDLLERELAAEPPLEQSPFAPVLTLPRIFEPEFCNSLIDYFQRPASPSESGFAAEVGGRTFDLINKALKRRQDVTVEDAEMVAAIKHKLETRLLPMVKRAFGWQATEIERYLITRYGEHDQGFFSPHRDDVTAGTAHRKFAVTLNLNTGDYEGGELRFPEFGRPHLSAAGGGCDGVLLRPSPRGDAGDQGFALRVRAVPLRRGGSQTPPRQPRSGR